VGYISARSQTPGSNVAKGEQAHGKGGQDKVKEVKKKPEKTLKEKRKEKKEKKEKKAAI